MPLRAASARRTRYRRDRSTARRADGGDRAAHLRSAHIDGRHDPERRGPLDVAAQRWSPASDGRRSARPIPSPSRCRPGTRPPSRPAMARRASQSRRDACSVHAPRPSDATAHAGSMCQCTAARWRPGPVRRSATIHVRAPVANTKRSCRSGAYASVVRVEQVEGGADHRALDVGAGGVVPSGMVPPAPTAIGRRPSPCCAAALERSRSRSAGSIV